MIVGITMKPSEDLGFVHVFVPAEDSSPVPVTLLLLHGTGGDERDLLPLGRELWPDAALLGVRGKVLENGMPRFFRRFAEGVFDVADLKTRTNELAQFIDTAAEHYRFSKRHLVAVGYSNGANIAASLMFLHPHYLAAGVLFRARFRSGQRLFEISVSSQCSSQQECKTQLCRENRPSNSPRSWRPEERTFRCSGIEADTNSVITT
jgi:predicted esterase